MNIYPVNIFNWTCEIVQYNKNSQKGQLTVMCSWLFIYMSCSVIARALERNFLHVWHTRSCEAVCCHFPFLFVLAFSGGVIPSSPCISHLTGQGCCVQTLLSWFFPWLGWFSSTPQRPWVDMSKMVQNNTTSHRLSFVVCGNRVLIICF